MNILWKYLKPQKWLIVIALILAGISQLMNLIDPVIFGKIIDDYALNPANLPEADLVNGILFWLGFSRRAS
jgi:ATP-binding cassette, subfamily B, bacterial